MPLRLPRFLTLFIASFIVLPSSFAASLRTLDGKTYEGEVKLDTGGQVLVTLPGAKPQKIDLADILQATFGGDTPKPAAASRTENGALPAPWRAIAVGQLSQPPYARFTNEGQVFSVKSAGGKLGDDSDAFAFVAQPLNGNGELIARFMTVNDPKKVIQGLMIRSGPEPGATFAAIVCVEGEMRFFNRTRAGGDTDSGTVGAHRAPLPYWMRLLRHDNTFTAFFSRDGKSWEQVGSDSISMRPATLVGIATCSTSSQLHGGHVTDVRLTSATPAAALPVPQSLKEGLMLRSGTLLAGAQIDKADDGSLHFVKGDRRDTLALTSVARIIFRELAPETIEKIPTKRAGVLLKAGDFVEGNFKGLKDGRIMLSSVLFGLAKFQPRDNAVALILNDLEPARPRTIVRTHDGSIYMAASITPEKDKLIIEDPVAGQFTINRWDVAQLAAGSGRLESLTTLKPTAIDTPAHDAGEGLFIDSTGLDLPMILKGDAPCEHGVTLTAGSSATWNLAGSYRTFTFKHGVPQGVLPTAPARFIVSGDGKELYKSPPQTSLDEPRSTSLSIKGITTLTLKVESTAGDLPTPGLFADPALVK